MPASQPDPISIKGLHHFAWRCRDAEETRHFYEDLLGLPLAHVIKSEVVPSTGERCPYVHIFFRMGDGSCIAFFDLGDRTAAEPSPNTPAWVNHIALELGSVAEVEAAKKRLKQAGVAVIGITDHHIIQSIYFFDPNGLRVELTARSVPQSYMDEAEKRARAELDAWTQSRRPPMGVPVSFADLEIAFSWVSFGQPMENSAYISRLTGKIHWVSEIADSDDPIPDDIDDGTLYIAVPHKNDLNLGNNLALEFAAEQLPGSYDEVCDYFRKRGAYARFKDLLEREDRLEAWYAYEAKESERALREWCAESEIWLQG